MVRLIYTQLPIDQRLEKAFEIAEKTINIPKLLDVNEVMKGTTDERALILYTSLFFHAFSAQAQARAAAGASDALKNQLNSAQQSREELMKKLSTLEKEKEDLTSNFNEEIRKLKEQVLRAFLRVLVISLSRPCAQFNQLTICSLPNKPRRQSHKPREVMTSRLAWTK